MTYPHIEPYAHGLLEVGDGHQVYWETCGNPDGRPALVLHGGPGSGCTPGWRRFFDPAAYRVVLFDQRGCGRSTPSAGDPDADLSTNTTHHLLADIDLLRERLGIDRWLLFGGSWGSTLGTAYAQRHPDRVTAVVLFSVAVLTQRNVEWITRAMGRVFPAQWAAFRAGVPEGERDGSLVGAYARLLADPDAAVREKAARDWCAWEDSHVAVRGDEKPSARYADPAFRMTFARLVTHYWRHAAWFDDADLLRDARRLAGIPGVLIHGRLDVSSPLDDAWELAQAWPGAELVDDAGHGAGYPGMAEAALAALDRFAKAP
ncbi:prolyl aminopeptidase [Phytohabitans kaempferiae]|uniref:Proline iminopeptidase n=1 Tax=Phytohabitans kaempferiae TaxID=1620943 RepID=A0ABV6MBX7_9ACTN